MRTLLRSTAIVAALLGLALPAALAQTIVVDTLFTFEGADGNGDVQGWEPDVAPNTDLDEGARSSVAVIDTKAINGQGGTIDAYEGSWMLDAIANRPLLAHTFRGMKYTWDTPQDWSSRPLLKVAASMNARGADSEIHEFRIIVRAGADSVFQVYEGLKSEEFDTTPNNTFVNEWEVLEIDLTGFVGLDRVTSIEAAGRNFDDGTINSPTTNNPTPGPDGNWGGKVQLDLVTIEGEDGDGTAVEGAPGLESLSAVYPNPSAAQASVRMEVSSAQQVTVTVVDVLGRQVQSAMDAAMTPGAPRLVSIDTASLAPGTYLVQIQGETFLQSRRLTVSR